MKIGFLNLGILMIIFSAFSQSLTLMPKDTELLGQKDEKQAEEKITIKTYKFHSKNSKEDILEFYEQMFSNEGFKLSKQSAKDKRILVFTKENSIILLNFVPDYKDEAAVYYNIQIQEFPTGAMNKEDSSKQSSETTDEETE
jgi:hypothetical protein